MALTEDQLEKLRENIGKDVAPRMRAGGGSPQYPGIPRELAGRTTGAIPTVGVPTGKKKPKSTLLVPESAEVAPEPRFSPTAPIQELETETLPKQMAASPYEISDSTLTPEARERFEQQPTAPGTRMRSGPGYGTRPEGGWHPDYSSGRSTMRPEPPRSIGDIQRYQREVGEQEREAAGRESAIGQGIEAERVGAAGRESAARTGIAQEESAVKRAAAEAETLSATQKQERLDTLMSEYDNPETTPKRRAMIERQTAMLSGRALPKTERDKGIIMKSTTPQTIGPEGEQLGGEVTSRLVNPYTGEEITPTAMTPVADRVEGKTTHKIGGMDFVWSNGGWRLQ